MRDRKDDPGGRTLLDHFTGRRILITGGAGYIATGLVRILKDADCRILRLDLPGSAFASFDGLARFEDAHGDLSDPSPWDRATEGADFVFHLAAQTSAAQADEDPRADWRSNVLPMLHLLETCRRKRIRPACVFSSTVTVAGVPARLPVDETHPDNPQTMYDLHKLMAEWYLKYFCKQGHARGAILRLPNVYGPGPGSRRADRGILNRMIRRAMSGDPLTVYKPGNQLRDYLYVEDAARAFLVAATRIDEIQGRHFVIGTGRGHSISEALSLVADRVARKTGVRAEILHVDPPSNLNPIERRNFVVDARAFSEATGWLPETALAEGIDGTLESLS